MKGMNLKNQSYIMIATLWQICGTLKKYENLLVLCLL